MPDFSNYADAIATILVFIAGGVVTWFISWLRSRRGNWVNVTKMSETPELQVSDHVKDELEITYDGLPVESLIITTLEIENTSNVHIEDFQLKVLGAQTSKGISRVATIYGTEDADQKTGYMSTIEYTAHGTLVMEADITRQYLRPVKKYKTDKVAISIISDKKLSISVTGGGTNWQARYLDENAVSISFYVRRAIAAILLIIFAGFFGAVNILSLDVFQIAIVFIFTALYIVFGDRAGRNELRKIRGQVRNYLGL